MSDTINYIIYDTLEDALVKADAEGLRRGFAYHKVGGGTTRYSTYPKETSSGKFALVVDGYELTTDEESKITTTVTFPTPPEA
tara:strand:+ start:1951 stop:2199 length:249 start_codon:yes stop_codon:yes gene_type:complete